MTRTIRTLALTVALALAAAGCSKIAPITRPVVKPGALALTSYMALGTSLTAGTESGGTAERHQLRSYASQFALSIIPAPVDRYTIDQDGLDLTGTGPMLNLISLSPLVIGTAGHVAGTPGNQALPTDYHNLGVPGALLFDVADSSAYYGGPNFHSAHFEWVVRHRGRILDAVLRTQPSLLTLEYGANEILGPATEGSGTPLFDVPTWSAILHGTLDALHAVAPNTQIVMINVPDITDITFARTFSWITRDDLGNPTPLLGSGGPLAPGSLVLLTAGDSLAAGTGFPVGSHSYLTGAPGNGRPLDDSQVLTPSEVASLQSAVQGYNSAIASEAAARGWAVVDFHAVFKNVAANGLDYGGAHYSTAFVTGGLVSLDGIHPTDLGYGVIANALIDAVNAKYGVAIPRIDLAADLTASSYRLKPAGDGGMPWVKHAESVYRDMFPHPKAWMR